MFNMHKRRRVNAVGHLGHFVRKCDHVLHIPPQHHATPHSHGLDLQHEWRHHVVATWILDAAWSFSPTLLSGLRSFFSSGLGLECWQLCDKVPFNFLQASFSAHGKGWSDVRRERALRIQVHTTRALNPMSRLTLISFRVCGSNTVLSETPLMMYRRIL